MFGRWILGVRILVQGACKFNYLMQNVNKLACTISIHCIRARSVRVEKEEKEGEVGEINEYGLLSLPVKL